MFNDIQFRFNFVRKVAKYVRIIDNTLYITRDAIVSDIFKRTI